MYKLISVSLLCLVACGGDDGEGGGDSGPCDFDSTSYLPFDVGNSWSYQVTELGSGSRSIKSQEVSEQLVDPMFGEVVVQVTTKEGGSTRSLFSQTDDDLVRRQQEDLDAVGVVERVSVYDPGQVRISETMEHLTLGATWEENYSVTVTEGALEPVTTQRTESWTVLELDVPCEGVNDTYECIHLTRERTEGGVAIKDFWFARGVGKVIEEGDNQQEKLRSCSKN